MRKARIDRRITLRELSQLVDIKIGRLSDLETHRAEPTQEEVDKLAMILGTGIKFADSEEAQKKKKEMEEYFKAFQAVHNEAKKQGFKKGHGGTGTMPCPKCGKSLGFSVASLNGHLWAKCSTENCLAWME